MKVIWVTPSIPHPQGTGGCAHEFELIRAMLDRGHEIEVVSTDLDDPLGPGALEEAGARVTRVTWQRRKGPQNRMQMIRAMMRARPSVFIWLQRDRIRALARRPRRGPRPLRPRPRAHHDRRAGAGHRLRRHADGDVPLRLPDPGAARQDHRRAAAAPSVAALGRVAAHAPLRASLVPAGVWARQRVVGRRRMVRGGDRAPGRGHREPDRRGVLRAAGPAPLDRRRVVHRHDQPPPERGRPRLADRRHLAPHPGQATRRPPRRRRPGRPPRHQDRRLRRQARRGRRPSSSPTSTTSATTTGMPPSP